MQALSHIAIKLGYSDDMAYPMGRPTDRVRTAFGERIVAAREAAGLTQSDLAARLGITQRSLSWWEREPVALKPEQIAALAAALGVSADDLLGLRSPVKRGNGPIGKARRVFEQVSQLPRDRQQHIVRVVEELLSAQKVQAA